MRAGVWAATAIVAIALRSGPAIAWGDEGHEVIGWIAQAYLEPATRQKVSAMLAADTDPLTAHNIADASTWADKFRDANENGARRSTGLWHFVDLELDGPDLNSACFGRPRLPAGVLASNGPPEDCVVDKIDQFLAELAAPATDPAERQPQTRRRQRVPLGHIAPLLGYRIRRATRVEPETDRRRVGRTDLPGRRARMGARRTGRLGV